jgi:tRNA threonylcarbamoyl adenosine modification protein YjeE
MELKDLSQDRVHEVVEKLVNELRQRNRIVVWLKGDMGSGKTYLVGQLLHTLGLSAKIPVQSPTYSFVHCYDLPGMKVAHFDLYRLQIPTDLEELSGLDLSDFQIVLIEWPQMAISSELVDPDIVLTIESGSSADRRNYDFLFQRE